MRVERLGQLILIKSLWNVTLLVKVFWTHLGNVQIDEVGEVSVQFPFLVSFKACCVHLVVLVDVFVGNNILGLAILVTWGLDVMDLQVSVLLSFINLEEEVLFGGDFIVSGLGQRFLVQLVLEVLKNKLSFNNRINFALDLFGCRDIAC